MSEELMNRARTIVHNWDASPDLEDFINSHPDELENLVACLIESVEESQQEEAANYSEIFAQQEADVIKLELKTKSLQEEIERLWKLLLVVDCPNCDGSGTVGGKPIDRIFEPEGEASACEWCKERDALSTPAGEEG